MESDVFAPRAVPWLGEKSEERQRMLPLLAAVGGAVALLGSFVLGARHGAAPIGRLQQQYAAAEVQVVTLQHEVQLLRQQWGHCISYSHDIGTINGLIAQGHFSSAAAVANLDLSNGHERPCNPLALAQLWYDSSVDALTSAPPSGPDDQSSVLVWESINARATELGLPPEDRVSPLSIIATAYNAQNFALCRQVFLDAWGSLIGPADRLEIATYYAATRNEGRLLATDFTGSQRREGLQLLATAAAIGSTYLQRGEAAGDLRQLVGPDWSRIVQPDGHDPVLRSLRASR
jgi:hypothetical protein